MEKSGQPPSLRRIQSARSKNTSRGVLGLAPMTETAMLDQLMSFNSNLVDNANTTTAYEDHLAVLEERLHTLCDTVYDGHHQRHQRLLL